MLCYFYPVFLGRWSNLTNLFFSDGVGSTTNIALSIRTWMIPSATSPAIGYMARCQRKVLIPFIKRQLRSVYIPNIYIVLNVHGLFVEFILNACLFTSVTSLTWFTNSKLTIQVDTQFPANGFQLRCELFVFGGGSWAHPFLSAGEHQERLLRSRAKGRMRKLFWPRWLLWKSPGLDGKETWWYCWWFKNMVNQLIGSLFHYLHCFDTSQVVVWDFWTINSILMIGWWLK